MSILESTTPTTGYAQALVRREAELLALLNPPPPPPSSARDVLDFKDMAIEETLATVHGAKAEYAKQELGQVLSALRRLQEGTYGECVDCGEEIDPRRLKALPATPYCTACQAIAEARRATPPPAQPPRKPN